MKFTSYISTGRQIQPHRHLHLPPHKTHKMPYIYFINFALLIAWEKITELIVLLLPKMYIYIPPKMSLPWFLNLMYKNGGVNTKSNKLSLFPPFCWFGFLCYLVLALSIPLFSLFPLFPSFTSTKPLAKFPVPSHRQLHGCSDFCL